MDLMTLFLVSFQIFQLRASIEAPQLTVLPKSLYYMTGQSATLKCSVSEHGRPKTFTFFKDKTQLSSSQQTWAPSERYHMSQLNVSNSGEYSCKYRTSTHSGESNPVSIAVLESPRLPFFSMSPKQEVYASGEFVNLTCSFSDKNVSKILLYQNNKTEKEKNPNSTPENKGSLEFLQPSSSPFTHCLRLFPQDGGNYSCRYWIVESGWEIPSPLSNTISISVTDPLPHPVLKVDPPSGEVKEGNLLHITCLTTRNNTQKRFHFSRDGVEMTSIQEGLLWSSREPGDASPEASVTLLQAKPSQTGGFACRYEEKMSSRWITSPWSQEVNITVLAQSPKAPLELAALAVLLPVLISLLLLYCRRKKKATKCQQKLEPTERKGETDLDYFGIIDPQVQEEKGSGLTYAAVRFCSAGTPWKPVTANGLEPAEEAGVLYSKVRFQPTNRAAK